MSDFLQRLRERKLYLADCRDEFGPPGGCRREATSDYVCD